MTKNEQFIQWVSDAHAMEVGLISTLEKQIEDAKGHLNLVTALTNHLIQTKKHAVEMESSLASLGEKPSLIKEGISKTGFFTAGLISSISKDTPVKNVIMAFAAENFEIACYTSLIAAAVALNELKIAGICEHILQQEKEMAVFLESHITEVSKAYLAQLCETKEVCV